MNDTLDILNNTNQLKNKQFDVLDKGFIRLVDLMGNDTSIVEAARVSYGQGTKTVRDNEHLIRYLLKHKHMTPFEMVQLKFHIKTPLFIARQWMRHRTGSFNEISARYSIMKTEFYEPTNDKINIQSKTNKQGRDSVETFSVEQSTFLQNEINDINDKSFNTYNTLISQGVTREIARTVLPTGMFTEFYWSVNLRNLLHFIGLRIKDNAQYEIKVYADILLEIVKQALPQTYGAYMDYEIESETFSKDDLNIIKYIFHKYLNKKFIIDENLVDLLKTNAIINTNYSKRDFLEFTKKLNLNSGNK